MADIDDLKLAFEQMVQAFNARDLSALSACLHEEVIRFAIFSPFPEDGKTVMAGNLLTSFETRESHTWQPVHPQYRVIGTTGMVWSHDMFATKPKDGPMTSVYVRTTITFAKVDGQWLGVVFHHSELPSGR